MTEMMIALYKNEKLVGYEWQLTLEKTIKVNPDYADWFKEEVESTDIVKLYSRSLSAWTTFELPNYDSFRPGIKLPNGKGWLFDGDKVKRTWTKNNSAYLAGTTLLISETATGILRCDDYGWYVENDNPSGLESRRIFGGSVWTWDDLTLVDGRSKND